MRELDVLAIGPKVRPIALPAEEGEDHESEDALRGVRGERRVRAVCCPVIAVTIDIKPGSDSNKINVHASGKIPVALLSTDTFDATLVDAATVSFGPGSAYEAHGRSHVSDIDDDGDLDAVFHFDVASAGITCGLTESSLTGVTASGTPFTGTDSIVVLRC